MRTRFPILTLLCLLASLLVPGIASASAASGAANRVWAFDLAEQVGVGDAAAATAKKAKELAKKILPGGCFARGTPVLLACGCFLPIQDVQVGDMVQAEIPAAVATATPERGAFHVTATSVRMYDGAIHVITVEDAHGKRDVIKGTPEHPMWSPQTRHWVALADLKIGEKLQGASGPVHVLSRQIEFSRIPVYNLSVRGAHSFRVGKTGLLVHNVNKGPCKATKGGGRGTNKLKPDGNATGPHSTWKTDGNGNITNHAEWKPNSRNPSGFDEAKRVDLQGGSHYNKATGQDVPTPHTHGPGIPGGVRPANPGEIPGGGS